MKTGFSASSLAVLCGGLLVVGFTARAAVDTLSNDLPVVTVEASDAQASEAPSLADRGKFTFHRTGSTNEELAVFFFVSGSAENGVDYTAIPTSIVFPAGRSSVDLIIDPIDDALPDGRETVSVFLYYNPPPWILSNYLDRKS